MLDVMKNDLINALREMDAQQQETDEGGGREIAWYYWRETIEDILEVPRGTLGSGVNEL
jgi:hypothetical protein